MAPNFLSKFVKNSSEHSRSRTNSSSHSPSSSVSTTAPSSRHPSISVSVSPPSVGKPAAPPSGYESSNSSNPNVTVIPPSPHPSNLSFDSNGSALHLPSEANGDSHHNRRAHSLSVGSKPLSPSPATEEEEPMTPTPSSSRPTVTERSSTARPLAHSASANSLRANGNDKSSSRSQTSSSASQEPRARQRTTSQKSNRSGLHIKVAQDIPPLPNHDRASTEPVPASHDADGSSAPIVVSHIVDSPTNIHAPNTDFGPEKPTINAAATMPAVPSSSLLGLPDNDDTISVYSVGGTKRRLPWRRSSVKKEKDHTMPSLGTSSTFSMTTSPSKKRRPTTAGGLASAIAASGLAMANPASVISPTSLSDSSMPSGRSKRSNSVVSGTLPSAGTTASSHRRRPSADYPRTPPSRGSRSRQTSISYATSDLSDRASFYSGDEGNELLSGSEEDEEDLDDLDLDTDIPVTGFAVASNRRNQEFHDMFANIPEGDYLIEDYGCALQREILVQGRLYISENHVCFHANIFGWVTDLVIPMHEVIQLEKRMTAFVIPNAIQISTRNTKYTFTSFLSRDTTYDVLYNVWRLARPDSETASALGSASQLTAGDTISVGMTGESVPVASVKAAAGKKVNKVTQCACGKAGEHFNEVAMDVVLPGTPEKIYNLMFTSGFIKEFMRNDQKLFDIQISDWMPIQDNPGLLARNMSYIKPLSGSIGPKQTKCEIHDELLHFDFEDYVVMMTTTRTPDVPSGGVFAVKTKTCITWASSISTRVLVTTQVEWSGRSFIKGIIEKSCIDGQKTYHNDLEKAMREYIHQHQSEFIPEGVDVTEVAEAEPLTEAPKTPTLGERTPPQDEQARKAREQERNLRGLQWAYDTFEGAFKVAKQSTEGALELIRDAWDQSSTNTILYFVIVILVISNIWTLTKMGKREEIGRRKEMKKTEEREQWVQGVVTALWEELNHGKPSVAGSTILREGIGAPDWRSEVHELTAALDTIEDRVKRLRDALHNVD